MKNSTPVWQRKRARAVRAQCTRTRPTRRNSQRALSLVLTFDRPAIEDRSGQTFPSFAKKSATADASKSAPKDPGKCIYSPRSNLGQRLLFLFRIVAVDVTTACERNSTFLALAQSRSATKSNSRQRAICCGRYCQRRDSDDQGRSHRQSRLCGTRSHAQAWPGRDSNWRRLIHRAGNTGGTGGFDALQ